MVHVQKQIAMEQSVALTFLLYLNTHKPLIISAALTIYLLEKIVSME